MLNRLWHEPCFSSSHMLYLTGQSTGLSDAWCFRVLISNKIIAKEME